MKTINIDLFSLILMRQSLINNAGDLRSKRSAYAGEVKTVLADAKGSFKDEAVTNLETMLRMMDLLSALMDRTAAVLAEAKEGYASVDTGLADQF